jgi:hypothetical protein
VADDGGFGHIYASVAYNLFGTVWAKIYQYSSPISPTTHDGNDQGTPDSEGNVYWSSLGGAQYSTSGIGAENWLAVWAQIDTSGTEALLGIRRFYGVKANNTGCESNCPEIVKKHEEVMTAGAAAGSKAGCCGKAALTCIPLAWKLVAAGFTQPTLANFNDAYLLVLRHADIDSGCLWECEPSCPDKPKVRLECELPYPVNFLLSFHYMGYPPIRYNVSASKWKATGPNTLAHIPGPINTGVPDSLTVYAS